MSQLNRPTQRIVAHTSIYSAASVFSQLLALFRGAVIAASLGPALFGTWTALGYIVAFSPYSNFGIFTGMAREYSLYVGKGKPDVAAQYKDAAFSFGMSAAAVVAAALVVVAVSIESLSLVGRVGLCAMAANTFIDRYFYFQIAVFRQDKLILPLSFALLLSGILYTAFVVPLIGSWGIYVLFLVLPLSNVPSIGYLLTRTKKHFQWRWDKEKIRSMIRIGLPVDSIGLVETLTNAMGGIVALIYLSSRDLGFYGVGMTGVFFMLQVPMAIAFITYPYLVEEYGKTDSLQGMDWYSVNLTRFIALVMPLIIGVAVLCLPIVVRHALPAFEPGILTIQLLLVGAFFFSLQFVTANFLVAVKQQDRYAIARIIAGVLNVCLIFLFLFFGLGLEGIAAAYAVTGVLLATTLISSMLRFFVSNRLRIVWFILKTYAPVTYVGGVVAFLTFLTLGDARSSNLSDELVRLGWQLALLSALYLPVLYLGAQRTGLLNILATRVRQLRDGGT